MALTQQFARVSPAYLSRRQETALDSPGAAPGWNPPDEDLLDTDWGVWGLIWYCRSRGAPPAVIALLRRAVDGDEAVGFLDHDEVYDGFDGPPHALTPAAVADLARALEALDLDALLADLPTDSAEAAAACGFREGFNGDVRAYLTHHFTAMREFYGEAARRGWYVVMWVD